LQLLGELQHARSDFTAARESEELLRRFKVGIHAVFGKNPDEIRSSFRSHYGRALVGRPVQGIHKIKF
jgi:hypothetical protein